MSLARRNNNVFSSRIGRSKQSVCARSLAARLLPLGDNRREANEPDQKEGRTNERTAGRAALMTSVVITCNRYNLARRPRVGACMYVRRGVYVMSEKPTESYCFARHRIYVYMHAEKLLFLSLA